MSGDYWDDRAGETFLYRGERFYTVTPIPFYLARRDWLLRHIREELEALERTPTRILDFGCGDGYYTRLLREWFPDAQITGYDPSAGMITIEGEIGQGGAVAFTASKAEVAARGPYDLVLCIAVLAHVPEDQIGAELDFWASNASGAATAIAFEQVARSRVGGATWLRRRDDDYRTLFAKSGWRLEKAHHYERRLFNAGARVVGLGFASVRKLAGLAGYRLRRNPNFYTPARLLFQLAEQATRPLDSRLRAGRYNTLFVARRTGLSTEEALASPPPDAASP